MSQYSESYTPPTAEFGDGPSAAGVARDEAADVAQHARQATGQVTQTATEQAGQVAAEAGRQAHDLFGEAREQVRDQASAQQQKASGQLRTVADELGRMVDKGGQDGVVTDVARQAADRLHGAATWLDQREPADLLDQVRSFARRRPGTFLIGAAVAGLAAGRLTRGLTAAAKQQQADAAAPVVTPVYPSEPVQPTQPVYPSEPVYPAEPLYPAEPAYLTEPAPGQTRGFAGPR